jgi:hypothetical protein
MMISIDRLGEWSIYFLFFLFIIMAAIQYIRARKPYVSGLIGFVLLTIIAGLFIIYKLFFPSSPFIPGYASSIPPIGLMWCIYYLTFSQKRRNRILIVVAAIGLITLPGLYLFSVFYR